MPLRPFLPLAAIALYGCSSPDEVRERAGVTADSPQSSTHVSVSASSTGSGKKVAEDTDLYSYALSYPAPVSAYPRLAGQIEREAQRIRAETIAEAKEAQAAAKANDFPFHPHSYSAEWQVVADLPGYLSLSNKFATYSGGAHGMYGLRSLVWDKAAKRGLEADELFISAASLESKMGAALCEALDRQREERRGEPVGPKGEYFSDCPGLEDSTLLVGSSNGKTFDRITVWFGPYVAGSYAEGAYELDFPVTRAMLEAVRPAYREVFGAKS